jgi:hypothetical protein
MSSWPGVCPQEYYNYWHPMGKTPGEQKVVHVMSADITTAANWHNPAIPKFMLLLVYF